MDYHGLRQSSLDLPSLIAKFNSDTPNVPRCLIINEVGLLFMIGGKENNGAERFLRSLLNTEKEDERFVSFCYLSIVEKATKTTQRAVARFRKDPRNKDLVEKAEGRIR